MASKFSIKHNTIKACLRGQTLLDSLGNTLPFYLTNSPARNKQKKPRKLCVHRCVCVRAHVLAWLSVFVCSGKSGVWILSSCLSDRKASSVRQRSRQHQSALCLISAALHIPLNIQIHIGLCTLGLYALTQTVFAGPCTTHTSQTPLFKIVLFSFAAVLRVIINKTGVFSVCPLESVHNSFT